MRLKDTNQQFTETKIKLDELLRVIFNNNDLLNSIKTEMEREGDDYFFAIATIRMGEMVRRLETITDQTPPNILVSDKNLYLHTDDYS